MYLKIGRRKDLTEKLEVGEIQMPINASYMQINSAYGVFIRKVLGRAIR
jgi:hypothetical protein